MRAYYNRSSGVSANANWQNPAQGVGYRGNYTIPGINGLTPASGDIVVATSAGQPLAGTSDVLNIGDVTEFNGTSWKKIVTNTGSYVPVGTRLIVHPSSVDGVILTAADYGKICQFTGTSNIPTKITPIDGWAIFINADLSVNNDKGFIYSTSSWVEFTAATSILAGDGLQKIGSTMSIKADGDSIAVSVSGLKISVPTQSNKDMVAVTTGPGDQSLACATAMTYTPGGNGMVTILVNGAEVNLGADKINSDCYFSADSGATAKALSAIASGDLLYWNGSKAGYELSAADLIDFVYNSP